VEFVRRVLLRPKTMDHINLSQELIDQYKEAFSLFDEDGDGLITGEELAVVMRALGHTITEAEIDQLILDIEAQTGQQTVDFASFLTMIPGQNDRNLKMEKKEIVEAFQIYDRQKKGFVTAKELRHLMTTVGEALTHEEVDEMFQEAGVGGDDFKINYVKFVEIMTK